MPAAVAAESREDPAGASTFLPSRVIVTKDAGGAVFAAGFHHLTVCVIVSMFGFPRILRSYACIIAHAYNLAGIRMHCGDSRRGDACVYLIYVKRKRKNLPPIQAFVFPYCS